MSNDIRTKAFVLRRTNYGEADRILNFLTEKGMISAIAKGVRKEKSKLAGGIELFSLSDIVVHEGRNNSLYTLTSAKMLDFYDKIPVNLEKLELGSLILKQVSKHAENSDGPEYFNLVSQTLYFLNKTNELETIEAWFWFNLAKINGEQMNLLRDTNGEKLEENQIYVWDNYEMALRPQKGGNIGVNEIKLMRLMLSSELSTILRIENITKSIHSILFVAKSVNKI